MTEYYYDNAGNRLAILDTIPPAGTIAINSGVTSTNSISVTLTLPCSDNFGCSQMQFSNDGTNYSAAEAVSYAEIVPVLTEAIPRGVAGVVDAAAGGHHIHSETKSRNQLEKTNH